MNKHQENEFDKMGIPKPTETLVEWFGKSSNKVEDERRAFAKSVSCTYDYELTSNQFFVRISGGELIDPYYTNADIGKARLATFSFRKVDATTFNAFMKYLKSKKRTDYTFARRLLMEKK
jgi:hypothetical protein